MFKSASLRMRVAVWVLIAISSGCSCSHSVPADRAGPQLQTLPPIDVKEAQDFQRDAAQLEGVPVEITNTIGMTLAFIPAGEFQMGSPADESERNDNTETQHRVRITQSFYMGVHEVTQSQYKLVMGVNPSAFSSNGWDRKTVAGMNTARFPVENVSWEEATTFCRKLSDLEGKTYRLPTEAEWEYACRARTTTPFHFGGVLKGNLVNCNGTHPYGTSTQGPYLGLPASVGLQPCNGFGLFDMHGNVGEFCSDWFEHFYYDSSPVDDPQGPTSGVAHVIRGGGWNDLPKDCRSAYRMFWPAGDRYPSLGFRVVLVHTTESKPTVRQSGEG